jgi:accessory colonization factor AcfC
MTQEEIIEMARDSGMDLYGLGKDRYKFVHHLEAFAKLVAAKEREACAKAFEAEADTWIAWPQMGSAKRKGAEAIRARGQK